MLLTDLSKILLVRSGQYIIDTLAGVNLDLTKLWTVTEPLLLKYANYIPVQSKFNIDVTDTVFIFTTNPLPPLWISSVTPADRNVPLHLSDTNRVLNRSLFLHNEIQTLRSTRQFLWEYENPKLWISETGKMSVTGLSNYTFTLDTDSAGTLEDVDIDDITKADDLFIDLVMAEFLLAVGRSKRAFTLNDLPITADGPELISEGLELKQATIEALQNRSRWELGLGV